MDKSNAFFVSLKRT